MIVGVMETMTMELKGLARRAVAFCRRGECQLRDDHLQTGTFGPLAARGIGEERLVPGVTRKQAFGGTPVGI